MFLDPLAYLLKTSDASFHFHPLHVKRNGFLTQINRDLSGFISIAFRPSFSLFPGLADVCHTGTPDIAGSMLKKTLLVRTAFFRLYKLLYFINHHFLQIIFIFTYRVFGYSSAITLFIGYSDILYPTPGLYQYVNASMGQIY